MAFALLAANALYGGIGLIANGLGMPDEWLDRMPGHSWDVGGWALLLTVAVPQAIACVLVLRRHAWAGVVGFLAGAALVAWIVVQLAVMQMYFILQPVVVAFGVAEMVLVSFWTRPTGTQTAS